jgi:hypothetical protein
MDIVAVARPFRPFFGCARGRTETPGARPRCIISFAVRLRKASNQALSFFSLSLARLTPTIAHFFARVRHSPGWYSPRRMAQSSSMRCLSLTNLPRRISTSVSSTLEVLRSRNSSLGRLSGWETIDFVICLAGRRKQKDRRFKRGCEDSRIDKAGSKEKKTIGWANLDEISKVGSRGSWMILRVGSAPGQRDRDVRVESKYAP